VATVFLTLGILISANEKNKLSEIILENRLIVFIGAISYSLYMWHQVLLAYARYFLFPELHAGHLATIFVLTFILSAGSYWLIEQPFRNRKLVSTRALLWTVGVVFVLSTAASLRIYGRAGVLKDVPQLGISKKEAVRNMHAVYNNRCYAYEKSFGNDDKIKVLVIGDSFGRDWINILLESKYANRLDISYTDDASDRKELRQRMEKAQVIFWSTVRRSDVQNHPVRLDKLWIVGTKNFGTSNGIFYNHAAKGYYDQRTPLQDGYLETNRTLGKEWGDRYLDLIGKLIDNQRTVPVFTPSEQFISQDCRHLTKAGARYYAQLFDLELSSIFGDKLLGVQP
jgi:hypothetical protein